MPESTDRKTFGQRVHDLARQHLRLDLLTTRLKYKDIQHLKAADRAETIELLCQSSVNPITPEHLKHVETPEDLVAWLTGFDLAKGLYRAGLSH